VRSMHDNMTPTTTIIEGWSTADVNTFIIQFIYCKNSGWDWLKLVFRGNRTIGPVLFSSVVVLQVWATVGTGCSPWLPPWRSKNRTELDLKTLFKDVAYIPKHGTILDVEDFDPAELGLKERWSKVGFHLLCRLCKLTSVFNRHGSPPMFVQSTWQWALKQASTKFTTYLDFQPVNDLMWNLHDKLANWLKNGRSHDLVQTSTNFKLTTEGSIFSLKFVYVWLVPSTAAKIEVDNIWCTDVWMSLLGNPAKS